MSVPLSLFCWKAIGLMVSFRLLSSGTCEILAIRNYDTTSCTVGGPFVLFAFRLVSLMVVGIVSVIQLISIGVSALCYFTVWNWNLMLAYFLLSSISSFLAIRKKRDEKNFVNQQDAEQQDSAIIDKLIASIFHILTPMTLFIDVVTWFVLVPMLLRTPGTEMMLQYMYSPVGYLQHGGNAVIMMIEMFLNRIPDSKWWSHGVVSIWSILFGIWSLAYFFFTGGTIYPFLDVGHPQAWMIHISLFFSGIFASYLIQYILYKKNRRYMLYGKETHGLGSARLSVKSQ
jgi:hypothetical protein